MFSIVKSVFVFDLFVVSSSCCSPLNASTFSVASRPAGVGVKALGECRSSLKALSAALCSAALLEHGLSAAELLSFKLLPVGSLLKRLLKPNDTERYWRCSSVMRSE